ncbi:glycosyltransferase family 4 protein, partial [uncultured Planktosalinus sp.]|uniref:glycosyltransferase family 4 protein n=1 Tax=uncultured Planktosalinus sp. TaxID=1810935 RepID=UPI0030D8AB2B
MQKLLIIGYNWPEPKTTGAGVRMMELIQAFLKYKYQITFVSAAEKTVHSEDLTKLGIQELSVQLNNAAFDDFIKTLNPDVVLFDRFYSEEQFGWRITEHCPDAIKILDTEDLHFLRFAREKALKDTIPLNYKNSDITLREIASIYRCDLSLIISSFEMELLIQEFKIEDTLLYYLPFIPKPIKKESLPGFHKRNHFIFIGNYRHRPNVDAVLQLKKSIWPLISKKLPNAELYCFGAYAGPQINQLHKPEDRFHIAGWTKDAQHVFQNARVLVAPLRFGAGLKGKLMDAMQYGTPFVTSTIGIEGLDDK